MATTTPLRQRMIEDMTIRNFSAARDWISAGAHWPGSLLSDGLAA